MKDVYALREEEDDEEEDQRRRRRRRKIRGGGGHDGDLRAAGTGSGPRAKGLG
jgi:hypothetical protein